MIESTQTPNPDLPPPPDTFHKLLFAEILDQNVLLICFESCAIYIEFIIIVKFTGKSKVWL